MNEHVRRLMSMVFIVTIAVIFALQWGPAAKGCESPTNTQIQQDAAVVNGKTISQAEFRAVYLNQLDAYRRQGMAISEEMATQLKLPNQVLENMISQELLFQFAAKQGIQTSDSEIQDYLKKQEAFKKDGVFDVETYEKILSLRGETPIEFETELRRELATQKAIALIENSVQVSDDEVKTRYFKEYNRANVTFVRFLPSMFTGKAAVPTEAESIAFAAANKQAISDYYEKNKFRFHQAEQVRARHILLKVTSGASAEQKQETKKKLSTLRDQILAGKDFSAAAKEVSEDVGSKENGGDLGFNERSAWVTPFAEAAFNLKVGDLSEPVETIFGYHLIKVEDKKAPVTRTLETVSSEIAKELLLKKKTKELAQEVANQALKNIKDGKKKLKELYPPSADTQTQAMRFEAETKPEAVESNEFNAGTDSLPRLGAAPEVLKAVFALNSPGVLPLAYEVSDSFVVAEVTTRDVPSEEAYREKIETLRQEALQARRYDSKTAFIKSLRESGKVVVNELAANTK